MGRRSADNPIDWELIEKEYRLGQFTLRQLAATHKVQPSAISRRAAKEGWIQDKSQAVKALSDAQLLLSNTRKATEKATPTQADIEIAAATRTNVVLAHRQDAARSRGLFVKLLAELEQTTDNIELFEQLGELMRSENERGVDRINDLYQKVISLGGRISSAKQLAEMLEKVVRIERQAYGIEAGEDAESTASAATGAAARALSDAERAVRLAHLLRTPGAVSPGLAAAFTGPDA